MAKSSSGRKAEDIYPFLSDMSPDEMIRLAYYALSVSAELRSRSAGPADRDEASPPATSRSLLGLCKDLGPAPGVEEIDEVRQEIWGRSLF